MIQFKSIRQYTHLVDGIRFPQNRKEPFLLIYFSENSSFIDDYEKLNLKRIDVRYVIVPRTKIPISYLTPDIKNLYKSHSLLALSSNQKVPKGQNLVYDLSGFLNTIDISYKVTNYRQRAGFLIKNMLLKVLSSFPPNYQKVLLYSVDATKETKSLIDRKIFPLLLDLKKEEINYDHLIMNIINESSSNYRLLIKDKDFKFTRVKQFLKNIKLIDTEEEEHKKISLATSSIMRRIDGDVSPSNRSKIFAAIYDFFTKNKKEMDKVTYDLVDDNDAREIATASILYRTSGDIEKASRTAKSIPKAKKLLSLKVVDRQYADELLKPQKTETTSGDVVIQLSNAPKMVDNKSPEHLFEKRKIDFETNIKKDMANSFKVLKTKEVPLTYKSIKIIEKPTNMGELSRSDINTIEVTLTGMYNKKHVVQIDVPKISEDGTFLVNGRKKCLINQIVLNPISFPKQFDSKFESSYSTFHIWSKRTIREEYLEAYIGSYKLPLMILLAFSFGFKETLKLYNLTHKFEEERPKEEKYRSLVEPNKYIVFSGAKTKLQEELCQSFIHANISSFKIDKEFGTKEYFNDLIIKMSGRINSTFLIQSNLENIVDPVAKQVLINQQLPSNLDLIMKYMASKAVEGFTQKRNDVSNQRIRNSEILVHLAQKQILASYTEYKEQVLSGNKKATFELSPTKVLSEFINSEIVVDMEYANPVEEMATKTRISPVGKSIGGIPDKTAIQMEGRNVHTSMYGNIDTLDTPEGENVGIVQQLTVDAYITSARGLITPKGIKEGEDSGLLSTTAAQIPFVENNDGNRVMFGCNQQRQSVPLKNPATPSIQTGYESILTSVLSDAFIKRSPCNGKIKNITEDFISVTCTGGKTNKIDIVPVHLRSGAGKNTLSVFKPVVKVGQVVKNKQIIAEGSCITSGSIALGRTLCVAFMPYKGHNFEDGIVISESVVKKELLTSLHGIVEEVQIDKGDRIIKMVELGAETEKGEVLIRKTVGEIEQLIGYDEEEEGVDIIAGHYIKKSPGGKIVDIEVFSNLRESIFPELKPLVDRTRKRYKLKPKEKFTNRGENVKGVVIRFKVEQELPVMVGDKLTNRHGAKGIISLIEKDENMPISPTGDRIDIILNPVGIIGRMNVGQFYETYTGLISHELGRQIIKLNSKPKVVALLNQVLPKLDTTKNKEFSKGLISKFRGMSAAMFTKFMNQVKASGSMTILIPPFKAPAYKEILAALKVLKLKPGYKLRLPEYNTTTKYPVAVGYLYMLKLEHIGSEKLHVRSTGPITSKTFQPTAGKRKDGGQRMGELDTYSFISYNCPALLEEFFGPLSDDHVTKNEILSDIIQTGGAKYRPPKQAPVRDLLNSYFISLMIWR